MHRASLILGFLGSEVLKVASRRTETETVTREPKGPFLSFPLLVFPQRRGRRKAGKTERRGKGGGEARMGE